MWPQPPLPRRQGDPGETQQGTSPAQGRVHPRDQRGAAAVEFALLVPPLLLVVFGMVQYGLYFWALQGGNDIARDAARLSAVGSPADCASFRQSVEEAVESLTGYGETVVVSRTYDDAAPSGINVGDTVEVQIAFRSVDLRLPFVPFIDDGTVTSRVVTRVEHVAAAPEPCTA